MSGRAFRGSKGQASERSSEGPGSSPGLGREVSQVDTVLLAVSQPVLPRNRRFGAPSQLQNGEPMLYGHRHLSLKVQNIEFDFDVKLLKLMYPYSTMHQNFTLNTRFHSVIRPRIQL